MDTSIVRLTQLPVIEQQLIKIKAEIESITAGVQNMVCTEDTIKAVKAKRAELNKRFSEFETLRKDIKSKILAPYEDFDMIYKDCITTPFSRADKILATQITDFETNIKQDKQNELQCYFCEYRESLGIKEADAPFHSAHINVTLSASRKSLKESAKNYLDNIASAIAMIQQQEYADEIMVEFRRSGNANQAVLLVNQRHKEIEAERKRTENALILEELKDMYGQPTYDPVNTISSQSLQPPTESDYTEDEQIPVLSRNEPTEAQDEAQSGIDEDCDIYEVTFTVRATIQEIKALKQFLNNGGYDYE